MFKLQSTLISLAVILTIVCGFWSHAALARSEGAKNKAGLAGYRFSQTCKTVGAQDILVTPQAMRIQHKSSGLVILLCEPFHEVFFYNTRSKKCIVLPLQKFTSPFAYAWNALFSHDVSDVPLVAVGAVEYRPTVGASLQAREFHSTRQFTLAQVKLRRQNEVPGRCLQTMTYKLTDSFGCAPQQNLLLQKIYGLPAVSGSPLYMCYRDMHNVEKTYLTTTFAQAATATPADFQRPQGYKTAHTVEEVFSVVNAGEGIELF